MASPPERTTLPPSSSSKFSKLFKFFTSKHNDTGSGMATNSGGQGAGATSGGISSTGVADSNCGDSDENDDDEISEHPSNVINQYLLQQFPEAEAAIVHDDVWMNLRFDGPMRKDKLIRSVFAKFEPTYDPINGVVSLVPKSL